MKIQNAQFKIIDWNKITNEEYPGIKGTSYWKIFESGNIRSRIVEYSPLFTSDHYCEKGHVILVLEGELNIRLKDGEEYKLSPGMSLITEDDLSNPHLVFTTVKTKIFIVD